MNRSGRAVFISGSKGETTMTTLTIDAPSCRPVTADNYSVTTTCCAVYDHPISDVLVTTGTGVVTVRNRITGLFCLAKAGVNRAVQSAQAGTRTAIRWIRQQAKQWNSDTTHRVRTLGTKLTAMITSHVMPHGTRMKDRARMVFQMARIRISLFLATMRFHGIAVRTQAALFWSRYKPALVQAGRIAPVRFFYIRPFRKTLYVTYRHH